MHHRVPGTMCKNSRTHCFFLHFFHLTHLLQSTLHSRKFVGHLTANRFPLLRKEAFVEGFAHVGRSGDCKTPGNSGETDASFVHCFNGKVFSGIQVLNSGMKIFHKGHSCVEYEPKS